VRDLRDRCVARGIAFSHTHWGGPAGRESGRELDGRIWAQVPADPRPATLPLPLQ
jgi:protein gp37